jgi:type IV secretion system protein VirB1
MILAPAILACAANIAPATLEAVIAVESRGDPLAIFDNTTRRSWHPHDPGEAIMLAHQLVVARHVVDLGLMQVDSANLPALGLSVVQTLDPCTNIRAGGAILTADYAQARQRWGDGQIALQHALSAYNAGDFYRGFRNGYVARYYGPSGVPVAVDAVCHPMTDRYHFIIPAAVHVRRVALLSDSRRATIAQEAHPVGDDSVYRLAALKIPIR